jgi:pimeloyl-ACP methyl ester carboxylesterase
MHYPPSRPPSFRDGVGQSELTLHGVRARAFHFSGGLVDPARALVCIAGMGADGRSFVRQRPLANDRWVLPLNLPYETPERANPLEFAAEVIEEYVQHERLVAPALLGSSFGGAACALVALRAKVQLSALVLAGPVLSRKQIPFATTWFVDLLEAPDPIARLVSPLAAQIMGGFALDREGRDELVREARHFTGRELKRRLVSLMRMDLIPRLSALRLPVLVVHGSRDWLVPWRSSQRAASAIPGARFELIERAGHVAYLSTPQPFNDAVRGFLDEVDRTRVSSGDAAAESPAGAAPSASG